MTIAGYSALVTGGGSGIGLGAAKRLAADGANVTICGRTESRLQDGLAEIRSVAADGVTVQSVAADVTNEDDVLRVVAAAAERTGRIEIAFACAGGSMHMAPIVSSDAEAFRSTVELNIMGTFLTLKHVAPVMARGGGGSFIGMSSIAGTKTHRYMSAYCVGKAGIDMLVRVAADELGPSNIRVNSVQPGLIDTEIVAGITTGGEVLEDYLAQLPIRRVGTVDDIAVVVRFLAGPESGWITGQGIAIDGGHNLRRGPDYRPFAEPAYGADALRGLLPAD